MQNELKPCPFCGSIPFVCITKMGRGWIVPKTETAENKKYLSTHTFYGSSCKGYEKLLQKCGFDVELNNWDKE